MEIYKFNHEKKLTLMTVHDKHKLKRSDSFWFYHSFDQAPLPKSHLNKLGLFCFGGNGRDFV